MCGRVEMDWQIDNAALQRLIELTRGRYPDYAFSPGEKFPGDLLPLLRAEAEGPRPVLMRWGYPQAQGSGLVINARAETAAAKALFCKSLQTRRCLLPVSGFFEWAKDAGHRKYLLRPEKPSLFYLAALYQAFGGELRFVILTREANASLSDLHPRMPVIIAAADLRAWLDDAKSAPCLLWQEGPRLIRSAMPPRG